MFRMEGHTYTLFVELFDEMKYQKQLPVELNYRKFLQMLQLLEHVQDCGAEQEEREGEFPLKRHSLL